MRKTFKYKALINKETEKNAYTWLYLCRNLYNSALEHRIIMYKQHKKSIHGYYQQYELPELKKLLPEYKNVNAQCLKDVIGRLNKAYSAFLKGDSGYPKFQPMRKYNSFTLVTGKPIKDMKFYNGEKSTGNGWSFEGKYLDIRNVGKFKLFYNRPVDGIIKAVTIIKEISGWYVCFSCDNISEKKYKKTGNQIGLDVGLKYFCHDSDGQIIENPKYFREAERRLRKAQRSLSRKKKGSIRRKKQIILVAKLYEKIKNQRKDFLHKVSTQYVKENDAIFVEKLQVKNMVKNRHLAKSISDASWSKFFDFLEYKSKESDRTMKRINPRNTSIDCSGCGMAVPKTLANRIHQCPECGLKIDRDYNAAINILKRGQAVPSKHNVIQ